jgi:hypothetical protein
MMPDQPQPMTVGAIDFHLVPKGDDQYDISNLKLPSPLNFTDPAGGQVKIEIGDQQFKGLWSKTLNTFLTADATYRSIKVSDPSGEEVTVAEITASTASTDKGSGLWDQSTKAAVKNMQIKDAQGIMVMAAIDMMSETHGMKLAELQKLRLKFNQLMTAAAEGQKPDPAIVQELRNYQNWLADSNGRMDMSGLSFTDNSGATAFTLDHFIVDGAATGMDQPKGSLSFGFQSLGLKVPAVAANPMMASFVQFIPSNLKMGFALEDVPPATIWSAMIDLFGSMDFAHPNEEQANAAAQAFGFQMLQMLQSAGSTFRMTGWEVETPASQLKLDGAVKPDAASPFGAVANINAEIAGFDAIVDGIVATMGEAGSAEILAGVQILRGFSNRETAGDGKVIDRYAIDLAPTGEITINGKPFDIMGAMMGSPQ